MDFVKLLEFQQINGHDLAILKYSNLVEFLKFLPESELIRFEQYKKLICPQSIESNEFIVWIANVLSVTELKQTELCQRVAIGTSKLSKFINNEGELSLEEKYKLKNELKRELIAKNLMKP